MEYYFIEKNSYMDMGDCNYAVYGYQCFVCLFKMMLGSKSTTMMPADCSVLCTSTILASLKLNLNFLMFFVIQIQVEADI